MRTKTRLSILSLLALLGMLLASAPGVAHAGSALLPSAQTAIVGTLVAAPQPTAPTMLLLQVGGQTIAVSITATTQVVDRAGNALSLASLHDGDTLQVIGEPNAAGGITASVAEDMSTPMPPSPPVYLTVQGTLASEPATNLVCLANAGVVSGNSPQVAVVSPCPTGQLPIYLTSATQYLGPSSQAYTLAMLQVGDFLRAAGTLAYTQFTAATVQDFTVHAPPPPVYLTVQGTLTTAPSANLLCLANAGVLSGAAPQVAATGLCPAGQLPVYLAGTTQYLGPAGQAYNLSTLQIGDLLRVNGTVLYNTQFTAASVQDFTTHVVPPRCSMLTGTVQYISPFTSRVFFTMWARQGPGPLLGPIQPTRYYMVVTVFVQRATRILVHGRWTNDVRTLSPGQVVTVMGVYNARARQVSPTIWVMAR